MTLRRKAKRSLLGLAAGLLAGRAKPPVNSRELYEKHFRISTRRMGVSFTENIRDAFRFRWLRKRR